MTNPLLLFALPADLLLEDLLIESDTLILLLTSSQSHQACPDCGHASSRVHSRYSRRLADLPCQGRAVELCLKVRRFFCENPACSRRTFAEPFPDLAPAYARRTPRQGKTLGEIAFAQWLREHLGVEVISRDRASGYAEGAKKGAPDAIQVADRYHLVANLRETLQRFLDRERQCLPPLQEGGSATSPVEMSSMKHQVPEERLPSTHAEALRQVRRGKRYERYQAVVDLRQQGVGRRAIARQTGLSRNTVHRYLEAGTFPEQQMRKKRRSLLDPYLPYLLERWEAGCQNAAQLCRELQERGYRGSPTTLRALISGWRASSPTPVRRTRGPKRTAPAPAIRRLSSRQTSFLFIKRASDTCSNPTALP